MKKSVFKIQSTVTLKSGDTHEVEDFVAVNGGMLVAASRATDAQMKLRYRDARHEWSDVVKVEPHHGSHVCDLTC